MEIPTTKEGVTKIIEICFRHRFKDDPKCDFLVNDYMKREIDIFLPKGYGKDENTSVMFCVKGSPNKMHGYIRKSLVGCLKCGQFASEVMRVCTDWGAFHLLNDKVYYYGNLTGLQDFKSCKQHK